MTPEEKTEREKLEDETKRLFVELKDKERFYTRDKAQKTLINYLSDQLIAARLRIAELEDEAFIDCYYERMLSHEQNRPETKANAIRLGLREAE